MKRLPGLHETFLALAQTPLWAFLVIGCVATTTLSAQEKTGSAECLGKLKEIVAFSAPYDAEGRSLDGSKLKQVGKLKCGEIVRILLRDPDWVVVEIKGKRGYVPAALIIDSPSSSWRYFRPIPTDECQRTAGPDAQDDFTIGLTATRTVAGGPLSVNYIAPAGPAATSGLRKGDLLWGADENQKPVVIDSCELLRQERSTASDSRSLVLYHQSPGRGSSPMQVSITAKPRREVYPGEAKMRSRPVIELVDAGRFQVGATLAQGPQGEFEIRLSVQNFASDGLLQLDEQKIFLLGANGEQLTLYSFSEWKRSIENLIAEATALAQGMEGVEYVAPPPPPPPTHYRITGTTDGTYTITPLGNDFYRVSGQSRTNYTVSPYYTTSEQIGQGVAGIAAIIENIRIARTNKKIKDLRKRAEASALALRKILAAGNAAHLDTTQPIAPGGSRSGSVAFLSAASGNSSSIRAVLVFSDLTAKKEYFVSFEFRH